MKKEKQPQINSQSCQTAVRSCATCEYGINGDFNLDLPVCRLCDGANSNKYGGVCFFKRKELKKNG